MERYVERGYNDKVLELLNNTPFLAFDINSDGKPLLSYVIEKNNMNLLRKLLERPCVDPDIFDSKMRSPLSVALNFRNASAFKVNFTRFFCPSVQIHSSLINTKTI